jgi:Zn-dependent protease with chaperone function
MLNKITPAALLFVILTTNSIAQTGKTHVPFSRPGEAAFAYFEEIRAQNFDSYLNTIRLPSVSPESKSKLIAILPKQDIVSPSAESRTKLAAVEPILRYHDLSSVIDLKVIRMGQAVVLFLAGAAVLISEEALDLLSAKEFQAIIAHELGHGYFWNEWQQARMNKQYDKMQEIELRCDALAVITMSHLGLDPSSFISAINKLTRSHKGNLINADFYPSLEERIRFIRAMIEIVKGNGRMPGPVASK